MTSEITTLDAESASDNYNLFVAANGTFAHGSGTVTVTFAGVSFFEKTSGTLALNNLILNHASANITTNSATTVAGNLTITAGTLSTSGSGNYALTVGTGVDGGDGSNGHLLILDAGELVCNSSTVIVGSVYCQIAAGSNGTGFSELNLPDASGSFTVRGPEKSGYVFRLDNQAECNHNSGTVTFAITAESGSTVMDVKSLQGTQLNNILVTQSESGTGSASSLQFVGGDVVKGNLTLTGNGTNTCNVDTNYAAAPLTVDGKVTVNNHSILGVRNTNTGAFEFGTLEIASGGTYRATSGTTTITAETSSHAWNNTGGTFTHNNGKVKIYDATGSVMGSTSVRENTFYDLEISLYATTYTCSLYDVSGNAVTILNNLDVTKGEVEFSTASDTITIHGLTNITADAKFCDNAGHDTNKIIHNGLVTNLGTYNINDGTTVKLNGGIRQLGTLTVK